MHIFSDLMMCKRMFMTFNYPVAVTVFYFLYDTTQLQERQEMNAFICDEYFVCCNQNSV